jgi:hypothetical protein
MLPVLCAIACVACTVQTAGDVRIQPSAPNRQQFEAEASCGAAARKMAWLWPDGIRRPNLKSNSECECLHIRRVFAPTQCSRSTNR